MLETKISQYEENNSASARMTKESVKQYFSTDLKTVYDDVINKLANKDKSSIVLKKLEEYKNLSFWKDKNGPQGLVIDRLNSEGGAFIFTIQTALTALGFDIGKIDGLFRLGGSTFKGVENFQRTYNDFYNLTPKTRGYLKIDGFPGKNTIAALYTLMLERIEGRYPPGSSPVPKPKPIPIPVPTPEKEELTQEYKIPGLTHDREGNKMMYFSRIPEKAAAEQVALNKLLEQAKDVKTGRTGKFIVYRWGIRFNEDRKRNHIPVLTSEQINAKEENSAIDTYIQDIVDYLNSES